MFKALIALNSRTLSGDPHMKAAGHELQVKV